MATLPRKKVCVFLRFLRDKITTRAFSAPDGAFIISHAEIAEIRRMADAMKEDSYDAPIEKRSVFCLSEIPLDFF